ncbi:hypothetical protein PM082_022622 [Marasmius tenuissimus]|nr:hypothetical protein PM082_022622 [Marasmius tenuissimus]
MITFGDFSAWITIGDKTCEEYDVQVSEGTRTVTCWIASEEGKEYEVKFKCNRLTTPTAGRVHIDGNYCGGSLLQSASDLKKGYVVLTGMRTSPTTVSRFAFSSVKTTDDNAFVSTPDSPDLGDIKITFRTSKLMGLGTGAEMVEPTEKTFHETAKKCASHQTRFQQTTTTPYTTILRAQDYGPHLAALCFKYRPLGILQANGIAPLPQPRSPSPSPSPSPSSSAARGSTNKRSRPQPGSDEEDVKPDVLELSDEDEDDDAKLRDLRNKIAAIEAKKKRKASISRKKVKLEPKREPFIGITIDLTDD